LSRVALLTNISHWNLVHVLRFSQVLLNATRMYTKSYMNRLK